MMSYRDIKNEATAEEWLEELFENDEPPVESIEEAIRWNRAVRNTSQPGPATIQLYLAYQKLQNALRLILQ